MRKYKYGFIGAGNMGGAMIGGLLKSGLAGKDDIIASVHTTESKRRIEEEFGIASTISNSEAAGQSDILILAVKPAQLSAVFPEISGDLEPDQIVVSVAAGKSLSDIDTGLVSVKVAGQLKVARVMPNTPALVGEAMSAVSFNDRFSEKEKEAVMAIFRSFGKAEEVPESMMDVVTGVSGSSPAFIYMLIEAMADEAVLHGMPRKQAYTFAAQSVLGSAKMVLETGKHPGALKDDVCSRRLPQCHYGRYWGSHREVGVNGINRLACQTDILLNKKEPSARGTPFYKFKGRSRLGGLLS